MQFLFTPIETHILLVACNRLDDVFNFVCLLPSNEFNMYACRSDRRQGNKTDLRLSKTIKFAFCLQN